MRSRTVVFPLLLVCGIGIADRAGASPGIERAPALRLARDAASPCDTLVVSVDLRFDPAIDASRLRQPAEAEASALWADYGVDLVWRDADATSALRLDAYVMLDVPRERSRTVVALGRAVVGQTRVEASARQAPIRVAFGAITALVGPDGDRPTKLYDDEIARALGRVLAHEIGHVLLGAPAYHDRRGLMRPMFHSQDIIRPERSGFRLADDSVARLRERIEELKPLVIRP